MKNSLTYIKQVAWLKPLRNAGWLGAGRGAQAVFSIGTLAFAARGLGVEAFGALVLIHSLALAVAQLCRFQSWQAVAKYGAEALEEKNNERLAALLKFSLVLDAIGMALAVLLMVFGGAFIARLLNLPQEIHSFAQLYGVAAVLLMNIGYTALGVMRLFDRFSKLALQTAIEPAVRCIGSAVLFFMGAGMNAFLLLWLGALLAGKLVLFRQAHHVLIEHGVAAALRGQKEKINEQGIWRFVFATHLVSTLRMVQTHLPLLMVGSVLGPAAAGLFRVARQFSDFLVKLNRKLLEPAIFPELSKLSAASDYKTRQVMVRRLSAVVGGMALVVFLVLAVCGKPLISAVVGDAYLDAYAPMVWLALGGVVGLVMFSFEPLLMAAGKMKAVLWAQGISAAAFVVMLWGLMPVYGLQGAGMAVMLYSFISGLAVFIPAQRLLKEQAQKEDVDEAENKSSFQDMLKQQKP